jgi:hypothetical protein
MSTWVDDGECPRDFHNVHRYSSQGLACLFDVGLFGHLQRIELCLQFPFSPVVFRRFEVAFKVWIARASQLSLQMELIALHVVSLILMHR